VVTANLANHTADTDAAAKERATSLGARGPRPPHRNHPAAWTPRVVPHFTLPLGNWFRLVLSDATHRSEPDSSGWPFFRPAVGQNVVRTLDIPCGSDLLRRAATRARAFIADRFGPSLGQEQAAQGAADLVELARFKAVDPQSIHGHMWRSL